MPVHGEMRARLALANATPGAFLDSLTGSRWLESLHDNMTQSDMESCKRLLSGKWPHQGAALWSHAKWVASVERYPDMPSLRRPQFDGLFTSLGRDARDARKKTMKEIPGKDRKDLTTKELEGIAIAVTFDGKNVLSAVRQEVAAATAASSRSGSTWRR